MEIKATPFELPKDEVEVVEAAEVVAEVDDPDRPRRRIKLRVQSGDVIAMDAAKVVAGALHDNPFEVMTSMDGRQRITFLSDVDYWRMHDALATLHEQGWLVECDGVIANPGWSGTLDVPAQS